MTSTINFYALSEQKQCEYFEQLLRDALPQWGITPDSINLVKYRENAVYKLTVNNGDKYAVRVHRANYHTNDELLSEITWSRALAEVGIKTSSFIPTLDGRLFHVEKQDYVPEPRQIDIVQWIEGEPLGTIEDGIDSSVASLQSSFSCIGQLMAQCHNQATTYEVDKDFVRQRWDLDGLFGKDPIWGRFWELDCLTSEEVSLLKAAKERLKLQFAEFGENQQNFSLIHADMLPENLLKHDNGYTLIDFDDSGFGWHMFDIATSLFFHVGEAHFDTVLTALIQGYQQHRHLPDEHLALLPAFLLARGTTYLGWAHTRKETDIAKELTPIVKAGVIELAQHYLAHFEAA